MNKSSFRLTGGWVLCLCLALVASGQVAAQDGKTSPAPAATNAAAGTDAAAGTNAAARDSGATPAPGSGDQDLADHDSGDQNSGDHDSGDHDPDEDIQPHRHHHKHHSGGSAVVSIGHKAVLPAGSHADSVVAIFAPAISEGDVDQAVVSVLGNTRVTGRAGDSAVAVMGSVYVNSEVDGDVVAVMGNVELGPEARVRGDVVVVGGELKKDPAAVVEGEVQRVLPTDWTDFDWVRPWIDRCLLYGRPLAFESGLGWAWGIALGALALYLFLAFMFPTAVDRCVRTLETHPGQSVLAAILTVLLTPVVFLLLLITVVGIGAIPFLVVGLVCADLFGKVVVLAAIGRRCTPMLAHQPMAHTLVGLLVGSAIALLVYTIPVIGFVAFKLLEFLGLGVVIYTLLQVMRARRQATPPGAVPPAGPGVPPAGPGVPPMGEGAVAQRGEAFHAEPTPAFTPVSASAVRAGFLLRMAALLLDVLLIGILTKLVDQGVRVDLFVLAAYGAVMWKLKGSTVGGIICGIQVVRLDGRPIDWATAVVRALSCFLSLAVAGLGFVWIAIDSERQSWHDKIAGTVVVRLPKGASLI